MYEETHTMSYCSVIRKLHQNLLIKTVWKNNWILVLLQQNHFRTDSKHSIFLFFFYIL